MLKIGGFGGSMLKVQRDPLVLFPTPQKPGESPLSIFPLTAPRTRKSGLFLSGGDKGSSRGNGHSMKKRIRAGDMCESPTNSQASSLPHLSVINSHAQGSSAFFFNERTLVLESGSKTNSKYGGQKKTSKIYCNVFRDIRKSFHP